MSGGYFEYKQYELNYIAYEIEQLIQNNEKNVGDKNFPFIRCYSEKTLTEFKTGMELIRKAQIYLQRIDWLVCDDDDEKTFHERLKNDLLELNKKQ